MWLTKYVMIQNFEFIQQDEKKKIQFGTHSEQDS